MDYSAHWGQISSVGFVSMIAEGPWMSLGTQVSSTIPEVII